MVKGTVLAVLFAVFASPLLTGTSTFHQDPWVSSSSAAGPQEAGEIGIHWQTDRVELSADALTLQLGDRTFTTEGAEFAITEAIHAKRNWTLLVRWTEDDHAHTLALNFRSKDTEWFVETINWFASGIAVPGGHPGYGTASFGAKIPTRTPPGQAFTGDLRRSTQGHVAPCDENDTGDPGFLTATAVLTIEGLHLSVVPRERSLVDKMLRALGLEGLLEEPFDLFERLCGPRDYPGGSLVGPDREG
jgi:hypothetical protein